MKHTEDTPEWTTREIAALIQMNERQSFRIADLENENSELIIKFVGLISGMGVYELERIAELEQALRDIIDRYKQCEAYQWGGAWIGYLEGSIEKAKQLLNQLEIK
jgi:hypothetical protein